MNITSNINLEYEEIIKNIIEAYPHGSWTRIILAKSNRYLLDYINLRTPLLQNGSYTLGTKIYWTLNHIEDFPKCEGKNCTNKLIRKNVDVLLGYVKPYCCPKCGQNSDLRKKRVEQTKFERYGDKKFTNRKKAIQTNIERYGAIDIMKTDLGKEKLKKTNLDKFNVEWHTQSENFKEKSKNTWLQNYGVDNPTKSKEVLDGIKCRNLAKWGVENPMKLEENLEKIQKTCLEKYGCRWSFQSNDVKEKIRQSNLDKYGFPYATQNPDIQQKLRQKFILNLPNFRKSLHKKYQIDELKFDSSWEIAFFIWLVDNNVDFVYQPNVHFEYVINNKTHYYFPDFIVDEQIIELKGDQFFKEDGTMFCPWRYPNWTDEDKAAVDALYEAKHQCMVANGVKILRNEDVKPYLVYIDEKYGPHYLEQFRRKIEDGKEQEV